jgi:hypothetical protein
MAVLSDNVMIVRITLGSNGILSVHADDREVVGALPEERTGISQIGKIVLRAPPGMKVTRK